MVAVLKRRLNTICSARVALLQSRLKIKIIDIDEMIRCTIQQKSVTYSGRQSLKHNKTIGHNKTQTWKFITN